MSKLKIGLGAVALVVIGAGAVLYCINNDVLGDICEMLR